MSTKIMKAPTLAPLTTQGKLPSQDQGAQLQEGALAPLAPQTDGATAPATPAGPALPTEQAAPTAPQVAQKAIAPADQFADARIQQKTQELTGAQPKVLTAEPEPLSLEPFTPFTDIPALEMTHDQAFGELHALQDLGEIKFDILDNGHVKLFSPAFDVKFRHTTQTEAQAENHWFDFPMPSMAVETARLAGWAKSKGIDEITHRGFHGESGEGIDFGPKAFSEPKVAAPAPEPLAQEPAAAPILDVADIKIDAPKIDAPKVEPAKIDLPKADAPAIEPAKVAQVDAPKVEPAKIDAPKTEAAKADAPAKKSTGGSFLQSVASTVTGAVKRLLQLDIAGTKGTDPKTGQRFDMNAYREFTRAPHRHYLQTVQNFRREGAQDEARMEKEREYQRHIERQMLDQLASERLRQLNQEQTQAQLDASVKQQAQLDALQTKTPDQGIPQDRKPAPTGAFQSPFSSLHTKRLFDKIDEK